jgi:hypothetical protein
MTDLFKGATGQLREDQGYCQVDLLNIYEGNYIVSARIEKAGAGTKISVESGNNWAKQKYIDNIFWPRGPEMHAGLDSLNG